MISFRKQIFKYKTLLFLIILSSVSVFLGVSLFSCLNVASISLAENIYYKRERLDTKKIVLWTSLYELPSWGWKETLQAKELKRWGCKVTNCFITSNKKIRNILWYDAVMFHGVKVNLSNAPPKRHPNQIYIFFVQEFPMYYFFRKVRLPDSFFNWTCKLSIIIP
jgi:hypothetical protein